MLEQKSFIISNPKDSFKKEKTFMSDHYSTNGSNNTKDFSARLSLNSTKSSRTHRTLRSESEQNLQGLSRKLEASQLKREFLKNRSTIKLFEKVPTESMPPLHIVNQEEVKRQFFESKIPPVLKFKADNVSVQNILFKYNKPSYTHFFKAKHILDLVKSRYDNVTSYFDTNFGQKITSKESVDIIAEYLTDNKISDDITINFAPGLTCSGRIISYNKFKNNPETRKFAIWINDGEENQFLRRKGIISLCDHEIGTHYYRSYNDGLQTWYAARRNFGLRPISSVELCRTEEGLAALHTVMNANLKFLFLPALFYYIACMADTLTFEQLYNHMETYIEEPEERWKLVTRVKRGISDPNQIGCYSRDQSYFEGAVNILENLDSIDFILLMSGKICVDELILVKKIARLEKLKLPKFLENIQEYKQKLKYIGIVNGIIPHKQPQYYFGNKNEIVIKDIATDSDIILQNIKTDDNRRENFIQSNKEVAQDNFKENFKDYNHIYSLNRKCDSFDSNDIRDFISKEIVTNKNLNMPIKKPNTINNNSSFCVVL